MKKKTIFIILVTLAVLGTGFYVFFQTSSKPPSTETEEVQVPTQTEILGWKTYTNTKYGYELQYPPEWEAWYTKHLDDNIYPVQGDEISVKIGPPYSNGRRLFGGEVSVGVNKKDSIFASAESYEDLVQVLQQESRDDSYYAKTGKEIEVDGERGFIYESSAHGGLQYTAVYVVHGDYVYSFTAGYENDKGPPSKTFPKILKTFKFIESQ